MRCCAIESSSASERPRSMVKRRAVRSRGGALSRGAPGLAPVSCSSATRLSPPTCQLDQRPAVLRAVQRQAEQLGGDGARQHHRDLRHIRIGQRLALQAHGPHGGGHVAGLGHGFAPLLGQLQSAPPPRLAQHLLGHPLGHLLEGPHPGVGRIGQLGHHQSGPWGSRRGRAPRPAAARPARAAPAARAGRARRPGRTRGPGHRSVRPARPGPGRSRRAPPGRRGTRAPPPPWRGAGGGGARRTATRPLSGRSAWRSPSSRIRCSESPSRTGSLTSPSDRPASACSNSGGKVSPSLLPI